MKLTRREWLGGVLATAGAALAWSPLPRRALAVTTQPVSPDFERLGFETLDRIERTFRQADTGLYAQQVRLDEKSGTVTPEPAPAFMWGAGVQLFALTAAARRRPEYAEQLAGFIRAIERYWAVHDGQGGYDVLPGPKRADRYYDDNAWIVLGLLEAAEAAHLPTLPRAKETMAFVLSGQDEKTGGIYWHEQNRSTLHTCSAAPTVLALLRLHRIEPHGGYLARADRIEAWLRRTLTDNAGLMWDKISPDGSIDRTLWSYNTAMMIRCDLERYRQTGDPALLARARRTAEAARDHWIDPQTGAVRDEGHFAYLLVEALAELSAWDKPWADVTDRALRAAAGLRDESGFFPLRWDRADPPAAGQDGKRPVRLIEQSAAVRALLVRQAGRFSGNNRGIERK